MRVSRKVLIVLALSVSLTALGCKSQSIPHGTITGPLLVIADRHTTPTALDAAIDKLSMPPKEPPEYWSRIANDSGYSTFHRRRAAMQLFKRHLRVKMQLSDLARLLDHPNWTQANDITEVRVVGGYIPIDMNSGDTVFALVVLREPHQDTSGVYLRIRGEVDEQAFRDLVLKGKRTDIGNATIAEIALIEMYPGRIMRESGMRESGRRWESQHPL